MSAALSARTLGELAQLTTDLAAPEHQPVQVDGGRPVAALFSNAERSGRWVVPATMTCVAAFGEVVLDLREALLQDRHVVLSVYAVFGRVRIIVAGRSRGRDERHRDPRPPARRHRPAGADVLGDAGGRGSRLRGRERGARPHSAPPPPLVSGLGSRVAAVNRLSRT